MKKALSLISVLVLSAGAFVSCGDNNDSSDKDDKKSKKKEEKGVIGTWVPSGETLEEMQSDLGGMSIEKAEVIFDEDTMTVEMSIEASDLMYLTDDSFNLSGQDCDFEYDGEILTVVMEGQEVASFERIDEADEDDVYGKYINEEMSLGSDEGEMYFDFVEDGVSYMVISQGQEYTYDEEEGTVTIIDSDGEEVVSTVEFDGDDMTVTDPDGVVETYTRAE